MADMNEVIIGPEDLRAAKRYIYDQKEAQAVGLDMETLNNFLLTSAADFKKALESSKGDIGPLAAWVLSVGLKAGFDKGYEKGQEVGEMIGYDNGHADGFNDAKMEE